MELQKLAVTELQSSETLKSLLNRRGFRLTSQRQKILRILENTPAGHHLSAEEIYHHLSQDKSIGVSTIYRTLHLMVDLGLLRELDLSEDRKYYELNMPFVNHHHLVCPQCGSVKEFEEDLVTQVGMSEAQSRGFIPLDCQFTVQALCPNCQSKADHK